MNDWAERLEAERDRFVDALVGLGFELRDAEHPTLVGWVSFADSTQRARIRVWLPDEWPYEPTRVCRADGDSSIAPELANDASWHQEADGRMCLFPESTPGLPWRDPNRLLAKIREWLDNADAGWPNDSPDLDLERYFARTGDGRLLLYDDLTALLGHQIKVTPAANGALEIRPSGKSAAKGARYGWVLDLGELERPVRSWEEIRARLGDAASEADRLFHALKAGFLLLRYTRNAQEAVVGLVATVSDNSIHLAAMETASAGRATRLLRAGYDAAALEPLHVTIVGVGAVGSFLADQLSRGGIGSLTLVDGELLRPGNLIRHFLSHPRYVGKNKAEAVRSELLDLNRAPSDRIHARATRIISRADAIATLNDADLVVDATGDAKTSYLLADAARATGSKLIVVYLERDGDILCIETYPASADIVIDPGVLPHPSPRSIVREGGCGDPVSPASPSASIAAAATTALLVADMLLDRPSSATYTYVLRPQLDSPYQERGLRA